jgi:hypothetical protein
MKIIAICGKAGTGKDYITSNYIIPYLKGLNKTVFQLSFADQLKVNIMTKYDISYKDLFDKKTENTRKLLQLEGTELGRNVHGQDIWIRYYKNWLNILEHRGIDYVITSDLRFKNELSFLKHDFKDSIIIKTVSPKRHHNRILSESNGNIEIYNTFKNHISECDLDDVSNDHFNLTINNDPGDNIQDSLNILYSLI